MKSLERKVESLEWKAESLERKVESLERKLPPSTHWIESCLDRTLLVDLRAHSMCACATTQKVCPPIQRKWM